MPILNKEDENEVKKYNEFLNSSKYTRLTQSLEWGKVKSNWENEVVYVENEGKIVASMLLLIQKIPIKNYTFMYSPRGPVCDINDMELVKSLLEEAKIVAKKYNAYLLKFDPSVKYSKELDDRYKALGFKTSRRKSKPRYSYTAFI